MTRRLAPILLALGLTAGLVTVAAPRAEAQSLPPPVLCVMATTALFGGITFLLLDPPAGWAWVAAYGIGVLDGIGVAETCGVAVYRWDSTDGSFNFFPCTNCVGGGGGGGGGSSFAMRFRLT